MEKALPGCPPDEHCPLCFSCSSQVLHVVLSPTSPKHTSHRLPMLSSSISLIPFILSMPKAKSLVQATAISLLNNRKFLITGQLSFPGVPLPSAPLSLFRQWSALQDSAILLSPSSAVPTSHALSFFIPGTCKQLVVSFLKFFAPALTLLLSGSVEQRPAFLASSGNLARSSKAIDQIYNLRFLDDVCAQ